MISFDEFSKIELKIGKIISAEKVEGSDKLLKLEVDFGEETRQVVSGIARDYSTQDLIDKEFTFVTNLEHRKIMGLESQGMILAADADGSAVLLLPSKKVDPGTKVR